MTGSDVEKDLGEFLYCSSLLEDRVARAYEHVAKLVRDKVVSCLLVFIARDSFKHAECFRVASGWLSGNLEGCDCEEVWGKTWKTIVENAGKMLDKNEIDSEELALLVDGLMKLESFAAEEYLTVLHVRLVELMAEGKIDLGHLKAVLEWIVEDEKRHEQILRMIENLLTKRRQREN